VATFDHDPDAKLDYGFDWNDKGWLGTDTINTSTWSITAIDPAPDGATPLTLSTPTHDTTTTTVWVDGGTAGKAYTITNHIVTAAGREDDRSHQLNCVSR